MGKHIVFQLPGQAASVMTPCDCGLTIEQIAKKDVPAGVPFWIVGADAIPSDRSMRDAWELDVSAMGEPDGMGGEQ